ncbi:hypothetical protein EPUS_01664 [Endocarpon pusillum Z07020]|uniref:Uncharacterized protein n=1 Tax=Endocarpon pusillum (strain Z07020 / HMAS-L-300199) TaxID=1263415 RepID=U1HRJ3_ENDPU|nr:uncharacterized protein EPUS_01664 [Endocarpon pusillum Z07020]ERF71749.1 hypothetical protein EPUS_01664 [Endocarpon pusillum Z07020]
MIRFPPTSIALSESDIEFHLREIQIKQQLYAQGFTPKEVQRYYNERQGQVNSGDAEDDVVLTLTQAATCSQAKTKQSQGVEPDVLQRDRHRPSVDSTSIPTVSSSENVQRENKPSSTVPEPLSSSPASMPSSPPVMQSAVPYRHAAVRQSSLLRIMHTAGSQSSTNSQSSGQDYELRDRGEEQDEIDAGLDDFLPSPATRTRSYRPRSRTYTYISSEAGPPTPPSQPKSDQGSSSPVWHRLDQSDGSALEPSERSPQQKRLLLNAQPSPSWLDPEISSPLTLPPPLSISRRTSSLQISLPDRTRSSTPSTINQPAVPYQPSPSSPNLLTNRDSDSLNTSMIKHPRTTAALSPNLPERPLITDAEDNPPATTSMPVNFPSIPPRANTSSEPSSSCLDSSSPPQRPPRTEPRNPTHRHNGTFGVYNDQLPARTQPQTPADLQSPRRRAVAERNVAYTAPPGQIRTTGRLIGADHDGEQVGAQSPTVRTARMRERRAREFGRWRHVRMEAFRGSAVRGLEGEREEGEGGDAAVTVGLEMDGTITPEFAARRLRFDRQDGNGDDAVEADGQTERRLIREWARFSRMGRQREVTVDWRDEFDEHRVGEENFETADMLDERRRRRDGREGRMGDGAEGEGPNVVGFAVVETTPEG